MNDTFEAYIRQGEPGKSRRAENWQIAIGLQDVDGLKPSNYLLETAQKHIEGQLTMESVKQRINDYYQTQDGRALMAERTDEADKVSANIADLLAEQTFSFAPSEYARIHRRVFAGVFPNAGEYRSYNITKKEWVLDGDTVTYELKNRHCHILWEEGGAQSVSSGNSKGKICTLNCTLEETAVLNFLKAVPEATQKQIAEAIGKSERTVKTITVALQEKGKLVRKNGKRNGIWQVIDNE